MGDIAGGGDDVHERGKVCRAADRVDLAFLLEPVREREDVDRFAILVELEHRLEDLIVVVLVEIAGTHDIRDLDDRVLVEHECTEHRLLGLDIVRGDAEVVLFSCHSASHSTTI